MADQRWRISLGKLGQSELRRLRDEIDRLLEPYDDASNATFTDTTVFGNTSFETDRSTLSSSATLNGSGRSTPQGSSISSGHTTAIEPSSVYDPSLYYCDELALRPVHPISTPLWPTYPSTNRRNTPQPCLRQDALRKAHDALNPSTLQASGLVKRNHFCTYCLELGISKIIKTKQDWKRHQEDYHPGTGNEWHCQYKGCYRVFYQGLPFKKHLKEDHDGQVFPRDCKEVRQQERIYACGFENCRELNFTWKTFCDHLSTHMQKGHMDWKYDRTIRNLLKQRDVAGTWKEVYCDLCPRLNVSHTKLVWDPQNTGDMKRKLEYQDFGSSLVEFLREVFFAGIPQANIVLPTASPHPPPDAPLPPLPSTAVMNVYQGVATSFGGSIGHVESDSPRLETLFSFDNAQPISNEIQPTRSAYRNSCSMTEAPALGDYEAEAQGCSQGGKFDATHEQELLSVEDVIFESMPTYYNPTPPLGPLSSPRGDAPASDSKRSGTKRIMSKSKEWLNGKRSQHFQQPFIIDHPDVPSNTRMPTSPSKKTSTYPANPAAALYMLG
ncbi:hypothetical protein K458DRAFT_31375 [Lentithecium fluviatile CBS 122367]|uniref:C2H2-type domain-containing protein n=1 Tax=Lentithecium fluviatile CBS 122367 TaxID=1168545 RepID=A0A6G1J1K8_9PLEO|nr:hypothetical protein K458DRAFT_31375 [Lentithecium fluviatile CBS 122367]